MTDAHTPDAFEAACGLVVQDWHSASVSSKSMAAIIRHRLADYIVEPTQRANTGAVDELVKAALEALPTIINSEAYDRLRNALAALEQKP